MSIQHLIQNISSVIVGKPELVHQVVVCLLAEGHVLLEDVPGTGKTTLAKALAQSIACPFQRLQGTADLMPSDITGVSVYNQKSGEFRFQPGPVFTAILLADELNRATPRAQSALLEAMAEQHVSVDGVTHALPPLFTVLATMNPLDSKGTYALPEAQMDRFLMKLSVGYPTAHQEVEMALAQGQAHPLSRLQPVISEGEVLAARAAVRQVKVTRDIAAYAAQLVSKTRSHPELLLGASPRGTLGLLHAAQAQAFIAGRDHVRPEDIQALVVPVLAHRLLLAPAARANGGSAATLLAELVERVAVPA
jgi:MoxR-like ATPase